MLFVNVFLIARIFILTDENFISIGLFLLIKASAGFLAYISSSIFCKKFKPTYVTRALAVLSVAFLILLFLFEDKLQSTYMFFSLGWGLLSGLYAGSTHILIAKLFKEKGTSTFVVWRKLSRNLITIVFPFTLGLLIDLGSFSMSILVVLALAVCLVIASLFVKYPQFESSKLQPINYFKTMKAKGAIKQTSSLWLIMVLATAFFKIGVLSTMLIIIAFGSNIGLGILESIVAAISFTMLFLYHKTKSTSKIKDWAFWTAAILPFLASLILFVGINMATISIFFVLISARTITSAEQMSTHLNATKFWGGQEFIVESNLLFQVATFIGHILGCMLLIMIGLIGPSVWLLAGTMSALFFIYYLQAALLFLWKRKYATAPPKISPDS